MNARSRKELRILPLLLAAVLAGCGLRDARPAPDPLSVPELAGAVDGCLSVKGAGTSAGSWGLSDGRIRFFPRAETTGLVLGFEGATATVEDTGLLLRADGFEYFLEREPAAGAELASATLRLGGPSAEGSLLRLFSFRDGELAVPPAAPDRVDLVWYFDGDDCSQGALIGREERRGFLFPLGKLSWAELEWQVPPSGDEISVAAIAPLTKEAAEGLAFWVRTDDGHFVLARIRVLEASRHADLLVGAVSSIELEWLPLRP